MNQKPKSIEDRFKQYYTDKELPQDVLVDLKNQIDHSLDVQEESTSSPFPPSGLTGFYHAVQNLLMNFNLQPAMRPAPLLAAFVLGIGLFIFALPIQTNYERLEVVAAEIALNHAKQFKADFATPNIAGLVNVMPLLDFAPVHPRRMQLDTYHVMGARYCTIDSSIAVQIHLEDETQFAYTLYEFRNPGALKLKDETVIDVGDIQVTLWQEGGVAMGLAQRLEN